MSHLYLLFLCYYNQTKIIHENFFEHIVMCDFYVIRCDLAPKRLSYAQPQFVTFLKATWKRSQIWNIIWHLPTLVVAYIAQFFWSANFSKCSAADSFSILKYLMNIGRYNRILTSIFLSLYIYFGHFIFALLWEL